MDNPYETPRLIAEYLLFHYGTASDHSEALPIPREAVGFPACVVQTMCPGTRRYHRALDLGCAVGRSAFELTRYADDVLALDFSAGFIAAAQAMQATGRASLTIAGEGVQSIDIDVACPPGLDRSRARFEVADACHLRADIGSFDLLLAANLICRLPTPMDFLDRLPTLVSSGGHVVLATPFSWLAEFTPPTHWLGNGEQSSFSALCEILSPNFTLEAQEDIPFLIREHARKFQYGISLATRWLRH